MGLQLPRLLAYWASLFGVRSRGARERSAVRSLASAMKPSKIA